ncbi:MAG: hypothetical protein DRI57_25845 [Deltaproteobacteria bacterium]|nr:MAG: hypothetical protein DRI57_25845 [Deltaproteobacteria bacterium]
MAKIQFAIEGQDAVEATKELMAELSEIPEVSATYEMLENEDQDERGFDIGTLADVITTTGLSIPFVAQKTYLVRGTEKLTEEELDRAIKSAQRIPFVLGTS